MQKRSGSYITNEDIYEWYADFWGNIFDDKLKTWEKILLIWHEFSALKCGSLQTEESLWRSGSKMHISSR